MFTDCLHIMPDSLVKNREIVGWLFFKCDWFQTRCHWMLPHHFDTSMGSLTFNTARPRSGPLSHRHSRRIRLEAC